MAAAHPIRQTRERVRNRVEDVNEALRERGARQRVGLAAGRATSREELSRQLIRVVQESGDRDAFELLYEVNEDLVLAYASRHPGVRGPIDPWDVVEETFLRVFLRARAFRDGERASFTGWILAIAANVIRDGVRRERASLAVFEGDPAASDPSEDPIARAIAEECREIAEENWGTVVSLCAASLLQLPPRWREALDLREGAGLSYREIAERMDTTPGYVSMLLYRARQRTLALMNRALQPYEDDR